MSSLFQLLEEVCALGRDASYVCQKTSSGGKLDQQQQQSSVFSSQSNNNSASSDDDDEDDDVASTHSGTTLKQSAPPSFADSQYVMPLCRKHCDVLYLHTVLIIVSVVTVIMCIV